MSVLTYFFDSNNKAVLTIRSSDAPSSLAQPDGSSSDVSNRRRLNQAYRTTTV
jgi:hypothetical protein